MELSGETRQSRLKQAEARDEVLRQDAVDFFFYRWIVFIVTVMILSVYVYVNLNRHCAVVLMALECLHLLALLIFNTIEFRRRDDTAMIARLRFAQFVLYRAAVAIGAGLFVWLTIGLMIDTAQH